jgi:hypothetical protein
MPADVRSGSVDISLFRLELGQIDAFRIVDRNPGLPKWRIAIMTRARQKNLEGMSTVHLFLETLADLP